LAGQSVAPVAIAPREASFPSVSAPVEIDCLTWNLHRCRGQDGRIDPDRTVGALCAMLRDVQPDLLVLTEAEAEQRPFGAILDLPRVMAATGLSHAQADPALRWGAGSHGFLGTIVFHGQRLALRNGHLLDLPGHYPRGAVILGFEVGERPLRLAATHLSLAQRLRIAQMRAVGQYLGRTGDAPVIVAGDLNEWRPWGGLAFSPRVTGLALRGPAPASFPSDWPCLPLDRVLASAPATVLRAEAIRTPEVRHISDHLPVRATIRLP